MKKVILSILAILLTTISTQAATTYNAGEKVPTVGANLLTKNGLPATNVKFMVVSNDADNSNYSTNKTINVSTNNLTYAGNDNEVAAVVANELGHIISGHSSRTKVMDMFGATELVTRSNETATLIANNIKSTKEEKEADVIAANLMVAAGYNPLAIIVVLTKQTGTYWDTIQGKPANADRALSVYNYITFAYPEVIKTGYGCNEYRTFVDYATSVINVRKASKKLESKNTKDQQKAQKTSTSQLSKFKVRGGMSAWDAAYGLLNTTK